MGEANSAEERYERLGLREALSRDADYAGACYELARTLRLAYAPLPKGFKSLVLDDTLFALRILPDAQTGNAISSANILVQAAEAVLPKQKKALVASEYKHSVIAHLRRAKAHQVGDSVQLPYDLLVHIFKFLDVRSLVAVSLVCWAWNSAANDNNLWRMLYSLFFGDGYKICGSEEEGYQSIRHNRIGPERITDVNPASSFNWKRAFRRKYTGNSSFKFTPIRAFCTCCGSIFWFSNLTCATSHDCHKLGNYEGKIRPISTSRVVEYLLGAAKLTSSSPDGSSSSDSDNSDSEDLLPSRARQLPKLWAYPKLERN
uniref:F-box domain-containing protein n=1 Tax=Ananas comosus var. bracteatus TaxID=296719 RepID=A0A6V7PTJ6_ANACO|nr:unnamed protein product [Ananas comosus var. bracteatus]